MNRNARTLGKITLATATVLSLLSVVERAHRRSVFPLAQDFVVFSSASMDTSAVAINDRGDVAGTAVVGGGKKVLAFRVVGDRFQTLPEPPGLKVAMGKGIALDGTVVGLAADDNKLRAVAWGKGAAVELPSEGANAAALGVGGKGVAVGAVESQDSSQAAVWSDGKPPKLLGEGAAYAVDAGGRIAGAGLSKGGVVAVVWQDGKGRALPTPKGMSLSVALGISGSRVVGASMDSGDRRVTDIRAWEWTCSLYGQDPTAFLSTVLDQKPVAVLWNDGKPQVLPGVGGTAGIAYGVNGRGVVVGTSAGKDGQGVATVWINGKPNDLNAAVPPDSGWKLVVASAINADGFVVGTAVSTKGDRFTGFRLGPIGR